MFAFVPRHLPTSRRGRIALGVAAVCGVALATMILVISLVAEETSITPVDLPRARAPFQGLAAYQRRCAKLNATGRRARILYEAHRNMTLGESDTVTAAVTFKRRVPADRELRRKGAAEEPGVVVSCHVQAQLSASPYQFEINETGWVERSLASSSTARWFWYVTPKLGGRHKLVLSLRPIISVRSKRPIINVRSKGSIAEAIVADEDANVQQYETSVDVNVPWTQRPQELMSSLADTFKIGEGLVKAVTGFVAAVLALLALLGIKKKRAAK